MTKKNKNPTLNPQLKTALNDTGFQRGLEWRQEKVKAIAQARQTGISEEEIFRELKIAGLTNRTARRIMADAFYLEDSEASTTKSLRKRQHKKNPDEEISEILSGDE